MNIKVYSDIAGESEQTFFDFLGIKRKVFSAESVKDMFDKNPDEKEFRFDINCNGGSVSEGFAIYDLMRTSGKTIHTNIDGGCHSMAVCILLAAPKENRTANPHATALIHDVRCYAGDLTPDTAAELANDLKRERERILNLYHDRTGHPKDALETIMLEEKQRNANDLLKWGFINKINKYTTNQKKQEMSKSTIMKALNLVTAYFKSAVSNFDFSDADGNTLFSTEKEDDSLEVGDIASPDGTFDLPDGRTVTIADGVVSEIIDAPSPEDLRTENENLRAQLEAAENTLREAQNALREAANIKSNAVIRPRMGADGKAGAGNKNQTPEERKDAARKGRANFNSKKGGA